MTGRPGLLGRCVTPGVASAACAVLAFSMVLATSPGCQTAPSASDATVMSVSQTETSASAAAFVFHDTERPAVFEQVVLVLRDAGYAVDRADYRAGVVTTQPRQVPLAVELWSPERLDGDRAWEATLSPMRRVVRVSAEPLGLRDADSADEEWAMNQLHWEVQLERYVAPTRRVINAARGREFSTLDGVPEPWEQRGLTARYWEPLGRDPQTEQRLARDFADR